MKVVFGLCFAWRAAANPQIARSKTVTHRMIEVSPGGELSGSMPSASLKLGAASGELSGSMSSASLKMRAAGQHSERSAMAKSTIIERKKTTELTPDQVQSILTNGILAITTA